jgi:glucokinase
MSKEHWAIGIDLGGTKIEVALVSEAGKIHDRLRTTTESGQGHDAVMNRITETVNKLLAQNQDIIPIAIGIGVAGQITKKTGVVLYSPNLKWKDVKLQEELKNKLKKPVAVCNDVRAAGWGEWLYGAGKGCDDLVCVFVGTGIGGSIVSGGQMLEGSCNSAGEIGHTTIDLHGPVCHCGNKGCFEALAGGWAIQRDAQDAATKNKDDGKMLIDLAGGDIHAITAKTVAEAAKKNNPLAQQLIDNLVDALIAGSVTIVNFLSPARLIFGGGIIEGMPELLDRVEKGIKKNALKAATDSLEVLPAKLHNDSGVIGAAALALHISKKQ